MRSLGKLPHLLVLSLILTGSLLFLFYNPLGAHPVQQSRPFRAALVDEVAVTTPDPYLEANVTTALNSAGYSVDYYGWKNVTIGLFTSLPSMGYGLIILRDHSVTGNLIAFVTSEIFDPAKYVAEQQAGLVVDAHIAVNNTEIDYFAVTPLFVRQSMQGSFANTIIIAGGCGGLANSEMAQALVSRGAQVYVSWDQTIYANQSDGGIILLIQQLIAGHNIDYSVGLANANSPTSKVYNGQLLYFPANMAGLVISTEAPK